MVWMLMVTWIAAAPAAEHCTKQHRKCNFTSHIIIVIGVLACYSKRKSSTAYFSITLSCTHQVPLLKHGNCVAQRLISSCRLQCYKQYSI
jgi:hypothetical protein